MTVLLLLAVLLVLAIAGFVLGRARALRQVVGNPRDLHSLPSYYGWYVALSSLLPALVVLAVWLAVQPSWTFWQGVVLVTVGSLVCWWATRSRS